MSRFSEYLVFVDESGDHSLEAVDPQYPMFILAFCIFQKEKYAAEIYPALARFKFAHFGHDGVVLHEHEIRKQKPPFTLLRDSERREGFLEGLNQLVTNADFTVVACAIRKVAYAARYTAPANPYHLGLEFGLERIGRWLQEQGQGGSTTHVIAECRGSREDQELELEFRQVCAGRNALGRKLPFELVMVDKKANQCGLQLSDLIARPIGRHVLNPSQPNRAYDIIERKLRRSPEGRTNGWGLKIFP